MEEAAHVRGGMYWYAGPAASPDAKYLAHTTPAGAGTSLGARTSETEAIYARFTQRKRDSAARVAGLQAALVQAHRANVLQDSPGFSAVIVASNGSMARMNTVHTITFVTFKRWMSTQRERDAMKRRRDALQAEAVQELLDEYLPQLGD